MFLSAPVFDQVNPPCEGLQHGRATTAPAALPVALVSVFGAAFATLRADFNKPLSAFARREGLQRTP